MEIRKWTTVAEEVHREAGRPDDPPLRKVASVVVFKNPFAGTYREDLQKLIDYSADFGPELVDRGIDAMGPYEVEGIGKGALIGEEGDQEHGVACLTSVFGDIFRNAVDGSAWITSATKHAGPGDTIDIPTAYKNELTVRSHYDAMTLGLHDAPRADEIAVIAVMTNRGRMNERLGGPSVEEVEST